MQLIIEAQRGDIIDVAASNNRSFACSARVGFSTYEIVEVRTIESPTIQCEQYVSFF